MSAAQVDRPFCSRLTEVLMSVMAAVFTEELPCVPLVNPREPDGVFFFTFFFCVCFFWSFPPFFLPQGLFFLAWSGFDGRTLL